MQIKVQLTHMTEVPALRLDGQAQAEPVRLLGFVVLPDPDSEDVLSRSASSGNMHLVMHGSASFFDRFKMQSTYTLEVSEMSEQQ